MTQKAESLPVDLFSGEDWMCLGGCGALMTDEEGFSGGGLCYLCASSQLEREIRMEKYYEEPELSFGAY